MTLTRADFAKMIEELLEVPTGSLTEDFPLADIDMWDSLAVVGFIAMADEVLEITPSPKAIALAKTLGDLLDICAEKLKP